MEVADSKEIDNGSNTITSMNQQCHVRKVDCAIIGAGAAGLQCAAMLLEGRNSLAASSSQTRKGDGGEDNNNGKNISIAVLEARERIGGRILTTHEKTTTVDPKDEEVLLCRDHGAAWVHGAHESNPMMKLLAEEDCQSSSSAQLEETTTAQQSGILHPVFDGNPWIRPHTVLHGNDKKGENSLITFFVNGRHISDDANRCNDENKNVGNDPSIPPSCSKSSLTCRAVRRHYRLLREMVSKYNSDESESDYHENVDRLYKQLNATLHDIPAPKEEDQKLINLLTPFYLYLMENWNGISMKDTEVDQIEDLLSPTRDCNNQGEGKSDNTHMRTIETDQEYVSAGDFYGPHCKVKTGMFTVLKPLIRILETHQEPKQDKILSLGEEVVSIVDKESHVRIETKSGRTIEAKCCVSTIPLGCLQHSISIQNERNKRPFFQPRLRDAKIEAIHSIWSGSYKKIFLAFDHVFWPKDPPIIGLVRKEPIQEESSLFLPGKYLLLYNLWARDKKIPGVEAILCGDLGKWAFEKSDAVIRDAVLEFIQSAMGLPSNDLVCKSCHVTRWEEDEFTRGSYSTFQLGTLVEHVEELGSTEWDGRLIFAGEATENDHMGSVHAALMSGKRAAQDVLECLSSPSNASDH